MGQEGVPSVAGYLEAEVPENGCLGFDGRVVNALTGHQFAAYLGVCDRRGLLQGEDQCDEDSR